MKYDNIINHNIVFVAAAIFNSYDLYMVLCSIQQHFL